MGSWETTVEKAAMLDILEDSVAIHVIVLKKKGVFFWHWLLIKPYLFLLSDIKKYQELQISICCTCVSRNNFSSVALKLNTFKTQKKIIQKNYFKTHNYRNRQSNLVQKSYIRVTPTI